MTLSIIAISCAVIFPLYFTIRKDTIAPPASLCIAVLMAAFLELFDLLLLSYPENLYFWKKFSLVTEAILIPAWFWFSMTYARREGHRTITIPLRLLLYSAPLPAVFALFSPIASFVNSADFAAKSSFSLGDSGFIFYIILLVYLVAALIQLEQTLVHTTSTDRWKIKFELLGSGAFLAMLVFYYSQGLLFRSVNMQMVPMRTLVLVVAMAMMFYSRLKRGSGSVIVHISQQIACKSAVLLAVGMYVIFLGFVGEGMQHFGNGFQRAMIFAFVFFVGLGLFIILLSETVKRRVTLFIHKNFYQNKYDYRNQWLQFTERLSTSQSSENLLHSIVSEFCDTFGMGTGVLFVINQERETFQQASGIGMNSSDLSFEINDTNIQKLINSRWIVDLRDNVTIPEDYSYKGFFTDIDACFIIPLFINEAVDGFILLGRPHSTEELYNYEDFDLMRTLAKQASSALLNLRLSEQLSCSRELAAIGKVSTFVMHDLKNLVSTLSLLLENAQEHITVPAFQSDLLMSLDNTVLKMRIIISRLKHLPEKSTLQITPVDLLQMTLDTAALVNGRKLEVSGTSVIAEGDREELQKVALNLMLNAVEATDGSTPIRVEVGEDESPYIRVKDEGCGIPEAFMQHILFKPFTSTKKQGMGIGLYQSRQIVEAHGGRIEVESNIEYGSIFTVWLPKLQAETA